MKIKNKGSILLASLLVLACHTLLLAQSCLESYNTIVLQSQVDEFPSLYPGCTTIEGTLQIGSDFGSSLTNLDSLKQITTIKGNLLINSNYDLQDLQGLEQLETIEGTLSITHMVSLTSLKALKQLKNVGNIYLEGNYGLKNLEGLEGLKKINGDLYLYFNETLKNIKHLENLEAINGTFTLLSNHNLENLNGLNKLKSVKNIFIRNNSALNNLNGLEALQNVTLDFSIENNYSLPNLIGLSSLDFIGGRLLINNNQTLKSLDGIHPTSFTGLEEFAITNNPLLESLEGISGLELGNVQTVQVSLNPKLNLCAVNSICTYLSLCKNLIVYDNSPECNEIDLIEIDCKNSVSYDFQWRCKIDLFPNPTSGFLTILVYSHQDIDIGPIDYEIKDMLGQLVRSGRHEGEHLDVSFLAAGTYYISIRTDKQQVDRRFVKN